MAWTQVGLSCAFLVGASSLAMLLAALIASKLAPTVVVQPMVPTRSLATVNLSQSPVALPDVFRQNGARKPV